MTMHRKFVIFTDLDGTLLDHSTYSYEPAREALDLVRSRGVPLVMTSSKTRAEIEELRRELSNAHPFISENGGAIFIPSGYFTEDYRFDREVDGYRVIELGAPHKMLVDALKSIAEVTGAGIRLLSGMGFEEIEELTGLSPAQAELAQRREYDEPFILEDEGYLHAVDAEIKRLGLSRTEGAVFHHLMGGSDKGKAVGILSDIFKREWGEVRTVALGDSLNDLPMLERVDVPVLVKKPGKGYEERIEIAGLMRCGEGPVGWNEAVLEILGGLG